MTLQFVLDLDGTLIDTNEDDHRGYLMTELGAYIHVRPYVKEFLTYLKDNKFPFGIYTSASKDYAQDICREVLMINDDLAFLFSFDDCWKIYSVYNSETALVKKLEKVLSCPGFDEMRTVMLDDNITIEPKFLDNLCVVPKWTSDQMEDDYFLRLIKRIEGLKEVFSGVLFVNAAELLK